MQLTWDTASTQLVLKFLFLCLAAAFPPKPPKPGLMRDRTPLPISVWHVSLSVPQLCYRFVDSLTVAAAQLLCLIHGGLNATVTLSPVATVQLDAAVRLRLIEAPARAKATLADYFAGDVTLFPVIEPLIGDSTEVTLKVRTFSEISVPKKDECGYGLSNQMRYGPGTLQLLAPPFQHDPRRPRLFLPAFGPLPLLFSFLMPTPDFHFPSPRTRA
eukprot:6187449-Pleurochrysis_carterae.AAC.2